MLFIRLLAQCLRHEKFSKDAYYDGIWEDMTVS